MWLRKQSGNNQHAAITTTITISNTTSNSQWTWEYVGLDVSAHTVHHEIGDHGHGGTPTVLHRDHDGVEAREAQKR